MYRDNPKNGTEVENELKRGLHVCAVYNVVYKLKSSKPVFFFLQNLNCYYEKLLFLIKTKKAN